MGQTKSKPGCKTWRRLSESDCVHLLNDDELNNHYNLNVQNNTFNSNQQQQQEFKYRTITNASKWTQNQSHNTGKFNNNLNDDHLFMRNRSGSACMTSTTATTGNSEATLLKFSKFENGEFIASNNNNGKQYNKNLFEANKNGIGGSSIVRKSLPPRPLMTGKQQNTLGAPSSTSRHTRFGSAYPALLEPELLMLGSSSGQLKPQQRSITAEAEEDKCIAESFRQSDLIESPPPLADLSTNPFVIKQSTMRPITMYQLDPFAKQSSGGLTFSHHPSSVARGLSLSDLLEQCNALDEERREEEEEEEFSDQTLVDTGGTMGPPADSEERSEVNRKGDPNEKSAEKESRNNKSCILVDLGTSPPSASCDQQQAQLRDHLSRTMIVSAGNSSKNNNNSAIRCSGLDCICDRCIAHRFKLLNWLLPNCTRINAERLLHGRMEGTFLVR